MFSLVVPPTPDDGCRLQALVYLAANMLGRNCRYLPAIGRFLIVVTFLEDALRIMTQWNDQVYYLRDYRGCMNAPYFSSHRPIEDRLWAQESRDTS